MKLYKFKKVTAIILMLTGALSTIASAASGKYGFSSSGGTSSCSFAETPFPLSFKYTQGGSSEVFMYFNIFYVHDDVSGMADYVDFYTSSVAGQIYWPTTPIFAKGLDTPLCTMDDLNNNGKYDDKDGAYSERCSTYVTGSGNKDAYINKGVSDYDRVKGMYPGAGELKIAADIAPTNDARYKMLIDVRKIKYLRIEVFTPYTGTVAMHKGYVEPAYFEYTKDGNNWLKRTAYGTTASYISPEQYKEMLPERINLNLLSDIQVDLDSYGGSTNFSSKVPNISFVALSSDQQSQLPDSCK